MHSLVSKELRFYSGPRHIIYEIPRKYIYLWRKCSGSSATDLLSSEQDEQIEEVKAESSSIETSKQQLHYLIREATEGNRVLPDFQRIFEWKREDVRDLLESILRGYYIGTILLWNVSDDETREKCYTFPIEGVDK